MDERLRVVATLIDPPAYFADLPNSIVLEEGSPFRLEYLLALLYCALFQWPFKLMSTNNNVATNKSESMKTSPTPRTRGGTTGWWGW